jgi:hypothetical protein
MIRSKLWIKYPLTLLLLACGKGEETFYQGKLTEAQIQTLRTRAAGRCLTQNDALIDRTIKNVSSSFIAFDNKFHELFRGDKTFSFQLRLNSKIDDNNLPQEIENFYIIDATASDFIYAVFNTKNEATKLGRYTISKSSSDLDALFGDYCAYANGAVISSTDFETLNVKKSDSVLGRTEEFVFKIKTSLPGLFSKDAKSEIVSIKTTSDEEITNKSRTFDQNTLANLKTPTELASAICELVKTRSGNSSLNCSDYTAVGAAVRSITNLEE